MSQRDAARPAITIALCAAITSCAQLPPMGLPAIARSALCSSVPSVDLTADLQSLRERYARDSDSAGAAILLEALANQFACVPDAALTVTFSYSGEESLRVNGTACIAASVLERRVDRPRFEHWVACDRRASLDYLIDFNNIETENEPINLSLRMMGTVVPTGALTQYFSHTLDASLQIADYVEFLRDGVMYTIDKKDQLELTVGR